MCYFGAQLKHRLGYDDALDAFGVHAIGGILGGVLTGFFATSKITGGPNGVFYANTDIGGNQLANQLYAITISVFWALIVTSLILFTLEYTIGLRVSEEEEEAGLDASLHGETIKATDAAVSSKRSHFIATQQFLQAQQGSPETATSSAVVVEMDENPEQLL